MAGVSPTGFDPKTFNQILQDLSDRAKLPENFNQDFPTSPDSVYGILSNIIAGGLKDNWDLAQSVADQANRDKAEGKYLNDLAALIGITRGLAKGSSGYLLFEGDNGAIIPNQTPVKDGGGRIVLTTKSHTLDRSLCYRSKFSVKNLKNSTEYAITIEGKRWAYTSDSDATVEEIIRGFVNLIGTQSNYQATSENSDQTLVITMSNYNNVLTTTNSIDISLASVGSLVTAEAAEVGKLEFNPDTLTKLVSPLSGIFYVTNPVKFSYGRQEESDEELRIRMAAREQSTGTATKPAIEASISEVPDVQGVLVVENISLVTDSQGRPPKSYEVIVQGGNEDSVASVIWKTKPAGIQTHGTITKVVIDANGDEQAVKFSRFLSSYAWVKVTYELNDEEHFPVEGEQAIKESVVNYGNGLYRGADFDRTKFYGPIYSNVPGIFIKNIEIAVTSSSSGSPSYVTTRITVPDTTDLIFNTSRVQITT